MREGRKEGREGGMREGRKEGSEEGGKGGRNEGREGGKEGREGRKEGREGREGALTVQALGAGGLSDPGTGTVLAAQFEGLHGCSDVIHRGRGEVLWRVPYLNLTHSALEFCRQGESEGRRKQQREKLTCPQGWIAYK